MDHIQGLSSKATQRVLEELAGVWTRRTGQVVHIESAGGVDVARRVRAGVTADVLVLAHEALRALGGEGLIVAGTLRQLFSSEVCLATGDRVQTPALDTEDDLVAVLRGAHRIAYSTGPSGVALVRLVDDWGLSAELSSRLLQAPAGVPVASFLAQGRADVGIQQRSELSGVPGVQVVGPLPGRAQLTSIFSGAILAASQQADGAGAFLDFLSSSEASAIVEAHGMQPAPAQGRGASGSHATH